jgi:hypothetical protein
MYRELGYGWAKHGKAWRSNAPRAWGLVGTAGQGLTSAQDLTLANTILGIASPYTSPSTNGIYLGTSNTQVTTTKVAANFTEWLIASDTNYARSNISITGWTLTAFATGVGVIYNNTAQIQMATVAGAGQTLQSVGAWSALTSGTLLWFFDVISVGVAVGIFVQFNALTDVQLTVL